MKDETNIEKLATLSRIYVSEEEKEALKTDMDSILSYVEQIQGISVEKEGDVSLEVEEHHNIMREDGKPHESGIYTEDILNEAPSVKGGYFQVRKIIDQDN